MTDASDAGFSRFFLAETVLLAYSMALAGIRLKRRQCAQRFEPSERSSPEDILAMRCERGGGTLTCSAVFESEVSGAQISVCINRSNSLNAIHEPARTCFTNYEGPTQPKRGALMTLRLRCFDHSNRPALAIFLVENKKYTYH